MTLLVFDEDEWSHRKADLFKRAALTLRSE